MASAKRRPTYRQRLESNSRENEREECLNVLEELTALRELVDRAIISIHRIDAFNTASGEIRPWTNEQLDFVERERLTPIGKLARVVAPRVDS